MINGKKVTKKLANLFINIGDVHINSFSSMMGYYEPKVSLSLLKKSKNESK